MEYLKAEIYNEKVMLVYDCTIKEAISTLKKVDKRSANELKHSEICNNTNGAFFEFHNGSTMIWIKTNDIPTLVHEIFHAACHILRLKGISMNIDTEEAYSYLIEHLTRQALKFMSK